MKKKLKAQIAAKRAAMRKLVTTAEAENREFRADEAAQYDALKADVDSLKTRVAKLEETEDDEDDEDEPDAPADETDSAPRSAPPIQETRGRAPAVHSKKHVYSVLRALQMMSNPQRPNRLDGLEREWSDRITERAGKPARGFYVPHNFGDENHERRNLTLTTGAGSIQTVTEHDLIEYLYNRCQVINLGAQVLTDMTSNFALPRMSQTSTAYWVAESVAPPPSAPALDQVFFTPRTIAANTTMSRKFIMQSTVDAEKMVRADLARQVSLGIDYAALNGTGTNNMPLGLFQDPNVPNITAAVLGVNSDVPSWTAAVALETAVANANADVGKMAYLTNARGRGTLKTTVKSVPSGTTYPIFLSEDDELNGYELAVSNQIPTNFAMGTSSNLCGMVFANWEDFVIAMFGALDILTDPFTYSRSGDVIVNIFQDADMHLRHEQSAATLLFKPNQ